MLIPYLLFVVGCWILSYITPKQFLVSYLLECFMSQPGTYLYHAHCGMQRETGLYGLIRVAPRDPEPFTYDFDKHYSERLVPQEHLWTSCWTIFNCLSMGGRASGKLIVQCKIYHLFYFLSSMCNCWFYSYSLYIFVFPNHFWFMEKEDSTAPNLQAWALMFVTYQNVLPLYKLRSQAKLSDSELAPNRGNQRFCI